MSQSSFDAYRSAQPRSVELYEQALTAIAGGVGHDLRRGQPLPIYIQRASGSHKWDVDGNEFIDYGMGNAALLLGHAPSEVLRAISEALEHGYHFGNDHPMQVEWAELIQALVPSAERIRFVNSGSEGSMLALRVARAYTKRTKILRFEGHFSGWHDGVGKGAALPFQDPASAGIPQGTLDTIVIIPADLNLLEETLKADPDIAAVLLEPSGASWGTVPLTVAFNEELRALTRQYGTLLIFDEVITGFRYAPGGYQAFSGVTPDLSVLGKVVAGGMPGGALVGRADIMKVFDYTGDPGHDRYERVSHLGTFNASPLAAAAGIATLKRVATGLPHVQADRMAALLRQGLEALLNDRKVAGYVYGEVSIFHLFLEAYPGSGASHRQELITEEAARLKGIPGTVVNAFQREMRARGVDILSYTGGVTSSAHTEADIQQTLTVFAQVIDVLIENRIIGRLRP